MNKSLAIVFPNCIRDLRLNFEKDLRIERENRQIKMNWIQC